MAWARRVPIVLCLVASCSWATGAPPRQPGEIANCGALAVPLVADAAGAYVTLPIGLSVALVGLVLPCDDAVNRADCEDAKPTVFGIGLAVTAIGVLLGLSALSAVRMNQQCLFENEQIRRGQSGPHP